jgi:Phytanoyl-CoA dioxygenase (PhyH)
MLAFAHNLRRRASPCRHGQSMIPLSDDQLRAFAERGYVVIGNVIQRELISAAMLHIDGLIEQEPPPPDRRGYHFYWQNALTPSDPLRSLLTDSPAWGIAEALIKPLELALPQQAQVSLNIPPWRHRPGGPHLDGLTIKEPSGRPGTFTLLAGLFLTSQQSSDMGNLWVWPGSHQVIAAHLRHHGPDALLGMEHPTLSHPSLALSQPEQVVGAAGDLLLAHYLLGHNMGGNLSALVRRVVYFRLQSQGHASRWRECVQNPLLEFAPVQAVVGSTP